MQYDARFSDLNIALEAVHAHFHRAVSDSATAGGPVEALCRLRLALHEWMTNLIRHARFKGRCPEVRVRIQRQGRLHVGTVEDNSRGFDLEEQLAQKPSLVQHAHTFPDGGMGLLLIEASTEGLDYQPLGERCHRVRLAVRPRPGEKPFRDERKNGGG